MIGDKKSPKKFPLKYGEYLNINNQIQIKETPKNEDKYKGLI